MCAPAAMGGRGWNGLWAGAAVGYAPVMIPFLVKVSIVSALAALIAVALMKLLGVEDMTTGVIAASVGGAVGGSWAVRDSDEEPEDEGAAA